MEGTEARGARQVTVLGGEEAEARRGEARQKGEGGEGGEVRRGR